MSIIDNINSLLPKYETILPFSNKKVSFTPFRVKDAKALSMILQEDNKKLALQNMVALVKSCTQNIIIEELCLADAEYLFLQIRAKSVDEILNLIYNNEKFQVNISEIKPRNVVSEETISLNGAINITLQTPMIKDLLKLESLDKEEIGKACIEKIVVGNEIYKVNKYVSDEIKQLLENLPLSILSKIESFLKKQPELFLQIKSNNGETEVSGLLNFFTYR